MTIRSKFSAVAIVANIALFAPHIATASQIIVPPLASEVLFASPNQVVTSEINYSISAPEDDTEVGLGLRVHFDSSKLSFNNLSEVFQNNLQPIGSPQDDTNNADNDTTTDKFFVVAWIDITGNWPGNNNVLPLPLLKGSFTTSGNFTGSTKLNYTASSTSGDADFSSTSQIICHKPEVSLVTSNTNIMEGGAGSITVNLDQAIPEECGIFSVHLNIAGSAISGEDYQAIGTEIIFQPNESSAPLTIMTIDDSLIEADKTLDIAIASNSNYTQSPTQSNLSLNISSNDVALNITINPNILTEAENNPSSTVTISRTGYLDVALDVSYLISGTAAQGQDFNTDNNTGTAHFNAGQSSRNLILSVLDDSTTENDETVTVTLQNNATYQLAQSTAVTLTIKDNDSNESCIDIDGNGSADALTDGITLARYLLGYRNTTLIDNSLSSNAVRTTPTEIEAYIETHLASSCYDIDSNGSVDALTDGILLIRYLSDYRGETLLENALGQNANRTTGDSIAAYIGTLITQ